MGHGSLGESLPLWSIMPFAGILLSIALFPLLAPRTWDRRYHRISLAWALAFAVPFLLAYGREAVGAIAHIYLADYVPFLILVAGLFIVSGGIVVRGAPAGTPGGNTAMLAAGTLLASLIGTTGAAMILIRPVLRANAGRLHKTHVVVFFIFLVANIGGCLTPLGDPPLFLGFLHGVPFFWTLRLLPPLLVASALLLGLFYVLDRRYHRRENPPRATEAPMPSAVLLEVPEAPAAAGDAGGACERAEIDQTSLTLDDPASRAREQDATAPREPLRLEGAVNLAFLAGIVGVVLLSGLWKAGSVRAAGLEIPLQSLARDAFILLMAGLSLVLTPRRLREANRFSWGPIREVAVLFAGIFMTIIPALEILKAGAHGSLGFLVASVSEPWHYFWATGVLSSFLDNAPTYLAFFNGLLGQAYPGVPEAAAVPRLVADKTLHLQALAAGAVFMGANTYIGNAPNFLVRSIAAEAGVAMPSFFGYLFRWAVPFLFPMFVLLTLLFFRSGTA